MKEFSQIAKLHEGKLDLNRDEFSEGLRELGNGNVLISVKKIAKRRSALQNAYYWGVVLPKISQGFMINGQRLNPKDSEHLEEVHKFLKEKFLGFVENEITNLFTGEATITKELASTTKLKTHEFEAYLHECRMFASEYFNIEIPLPNQLFTPPEVPS